MMDDRATFSRFQLPDWSIDIPDRATFLEAFRQARDALLRQRLKVDYLLVGRGILATLDWRFNDPNTPPLLHIDDYRRRFLYGEEFLYCPTLPDYQVVAVPEGHYQYTVDLPEGATQHAYPARRTEPPRDTRPMGQAARTCSAPQEGRKVCCLQH